MPSKKVIISAALSLTFSLFVLALSFFCFGWMCNNMQTNSNGLQVTTDAPIEISFHTYSYDKENEQFLSSSGTDVSLPAYDSIFMEYNVNLATVLELTIKNIPDGTENLSLILNRTNHNDTSINELNHYSSSIIKISLYCTTTQSANAEAIWSSATINAVGNNVFTTEVNNGYQKVNYINLNQILTAAQSSADTLYLYLIFDYSEVLISDYIQQYDIFDSEIGDISSVVTFENDIGVLEVAIS